jgi:ubiquinone/menaquinone biosynthesis C-methylase UbiE
MTDLLSLKRTWENLAQTDPLWAICTDSTRQAGKWDEAEFFATGEAEISKVLEYVAGIGLKPRWEGGALDFGCGVGRLTQALCKRFAECVGVDISPTMIRLAQQHNRHGQRCVYALNDSEDLGKYGDGEFAFIYSSIVLQHMAPEYMRSYLHEFARLLTPGGMLVCQIPDYKPRLRQRLKLRTRLKKLAGMKLPEPAPEIQTQQMEMHSLEERQVRQTLRDGGCRVVDVQFTNSTSPDFNGQLVYLKGRVKPGGVSKQYCAVKSRGAHGH